MHIDVDLWVILARDALWSAIAATCFAILFNVPRRNLFGCALVGAAGHSLRKFLMEQGLTIEVGTLAGAICMGFLGAYFARRLRTPTVVFTVSGAITMVPGVFAYRTMIGLLNLSQPDASIDILMETVMNAMKTGLILGAIAGGIISPNLIFQRPKPVV